MRLQCQRWLLVFALLPLSAAHGANEPSAEVVLVRAVSTDGAVEFGSGVIIARDRVATACHVTRRAVSVEIERNERHSVAQAQRGSLLHDLCILDVPTGDLPIARIRASPELHAGEAVVAAGFEGGREQLIIKRGNVAALYPYDNASVIRTSAAFDFGSSGGGLFDENGELVGLLAFKARSGENLRFALPVEWLSLSSPVAASFSPIVATSTTPAFWQRTREDRPTFLGVALHDVAAELPH